ncbi:MAG TPA: AGE family epimerase/isomerase [Candidatus Brocadiia bacterium]|nr:AGE family epimerase/isomerase [Candidatus Brocadiia bacterium]
MKEYLERTESYLTGKLIPFWAGRVVEPKFGGFQTNYDRQGRRTAVTEKTLLCQGRALFTIAHALRHGFEWPGGREAMDQGIEFLRRFFRDAEHDGYYWICEEDGRPKDARKVVYGHSFLIYGLAEHGLLTGSADSRREAERLFDLLAAKAADFRHGGFFEQFDRAFNPVSERPDGALHKSLDVHMHLMEAFTTLYQLTGLPRHRQALEQVMELIFDRMVDPETGVGVSIFSPSWQPMANLQLGAVWGSDRFERKAKPADITSYGHNIELAWLYLHAMDALGRPRQEGLARVRRIFDHTFERGVDREFGGLYVEGPRQGAASETNKEFWQQAEALVGFLDAYDLTQEKKFQRAFRNVHDFVFKKMICWDQGEWYPLLDRQGAVVWDYMGHNWKICYHTVRAMVEVVLRLRRMGGRAG